MGPKHFQNKARREWWSIHIEAWQRSGLSQRAYCRRHRPGDVRALAEGTCWRGSCTQAREISDGIAPRRTERRTEKDTAATLLDQHGRASSRFASILGNARRGDELERNGCTRVCRGTVPVAVRAAQMAPPVGRRRARNRLACASSPFSPPRR
ncbi:IS66 family insertion sequence element accessory protein TnpA [Bradyrhizobium sp. ISRA442]|uniref:IS66 family insertion sequence element accessory protein TnpA n=1 Tax=Bradyrhizobium sp. ISRA442 TaxID=2866197 RepID=UPI00404B8EA7